METQYCRWCEGRIKDLCSHLICKKSIARGFCCTGCERASDNAKIKAVAL